MRAPRELATGDKDHLVGPERAQARLAAWVVQVVAALTARIRHHFTVTVIRIEGWMLQRIMNVPALSNV